MRTSSFGLHVWMRTEITTLKLTYVLDQCDKAPNNSSVLTEKEVDWTDTK